MTITITPGDAIVLGIIVLIVNVLVHVLEQRRLNNYWRGAYYEAHETIMADLDRRQAENHRSTYGHVIDVGGGQIGVLVERDTENYPAPGASVRVTQIGDAA